MASDEVSPDCVMAAVDVLVGSAAAFGEAVSDAVLVALGSAAKLYTCFDI